jgi:hypothetical protein
MREEDETITCTLLDTICALAFLAQTGYCFFHERAFWA